MPRLAKRHAATGSWQSMLWARKVFHQRRPGTTANGRVSTSRSSASGISKEMAIKKHKKTQELELHFSLCFFALFVAILLRESEPGDKYAYRTHDSRCL